MPRDPKVLRVYLQAHQEAHKNRVNLFRLEEIEDLFPPNLQLDLIPVHAVAMPGHSTAIITEDQLRECLAAFTSAREESDPWWCHVMLAGSMAEEPGAFGAAFNAHESQWRFIRRGCALFLREIDDKDSPTEKRLLKRTLAHELGHVLNLAHEDGAGNTIMAARPEVEAMELRWSPISRAHLDEHEDWCLQPGGRWFTCPGHEDRADDFFTRLVSRDVA